MAINKTKNNASDRRDTKTMTGAEQRWETVIGLEIHAQLKTHTKLFCRCSTLFGEKANANVCPVCLAYPGALPVLNKEAVKMAIQVGLALNSKVNEMSYFERKNYFYPDLPKAYQISQLKQPICEGGELTITLSDRHGNKIAGEHGTKCIQIERIQLEEDAGKLIHSQDVSIKESYVDLNRTSTPLLEIVSKPDMRSSAEALAYMKTLRRVLLYLEVSDGNMQEGSLRCDANISLRPQGSSKLGTRTEIKNMNTFKGIEAALEYEIKRQRAVLENGDRVDQETLLYDSTLKRTRPMRSKEEARDYRYFPDPDLLPVIVKPSYLADLKTGLPELPYAKRDRFMKEYGLSFYDSTLLVEERALANYYEQAVVAATNLKRSEHIPKRVANWMTTEVLSILNEHYISIETFSIAAADLGELVATIEMGQISGKMAKEVFKEMLATKQSPHKIIADRGYKVVADKDALGSIIDTVLKDYAKAVTEYRNGKKQSFGYLVGQVMRATKGQADPKAVDTLLKEKINQK
ncbi:aspartyl/glutamyl-tRNA(Asn/Gln) amidotransferase subunit B [Spirochaetota bacterium]|nr:aspartyl/glutamyl-tRNA(Asn/Gln) amidotransferase subunit B [Spirochaetota bacterium]